MDFNEKFNRLDVEAANAMAMSESWLKGQEAYVTKMMSYVHQQKEEKKSSARKAVTAYAGGTVVVRPGRGKARHKGVKKYGMKVAKMRNVLSGLQVDADGNVVIVTAGGADSVLARALKRKLDKLKKQGQKVVVKGYKGLKNAHVTKKSTKKIG